MEPADELVLFGTRECRECRESWREREGGRMREESRKGDVDNPHAAGDKAWLTGTPRYACLVPRDFHPKSLAAIPFPSPTPLRPFCHPSSFTKLRMNTMDSMMQVSSIPFTRFVFFFLGDDIEINYHNSKRDQRWPGQY